MILNPSLIIDCYSKKREISLELLQIIDRFPEFLSKEKIIPEFKSTSRRRGVSNVSSLKDTVSVCSALSRVKLDRVLFK